MNQRRVAWAIARKDMKSITSNIQVWLPMIIIPVILGILLPGGMVAMARFVDLASYIQGKGDFILQLIEKMKGSSLYEELNAFPSFNQKIVYLVANDLYISFFLMIPVMVSSVVSANSFVGEKERKTIESLLMAPITIRTIFLGKILSAFVPTMLITLGTAFFYGIVVDLLAFPLFGRIIFPTLNWIILLFWMIPVLSLSVIFLNVIVSARVKTFQEAYQLGGVVVLPLLLLLAAQLAGLLYFNSGLLFLFGGILLVINIWLLQVISKWNDRVVLMERQL